MFLAAKHDQPRKVLRPHQERAISKLRSSLGQGHKRVVLQGSVGFGKTLVAATIIRGALEKGNKVIFTAPMISLINQTVSAFEAEGIWDIGVMQANHPRTDETAMVQIASVQTLQRRDIPQAAMVIVDECHIKSKVIEKLMEERPDIYFVGLSATPWAKGMGLMWQDLVIPCTMAELVETGYLSKYEVFAPHVPDLSGVKVKAGEYVESDVERVMSEGGIVASVVQTWLEKGENRPTLCFGVNRAHAAKMHESFISSGVASEYVDGMIDMVEREIIARRFRSGETKVVCSVRTMTTGVDLPVSCIVDAAPTKSEMLHIQKLGRGMRINPGTEDLVVLDHAGNCLRLGLPTEIHYETLDTSKPGEPQEKKPKADKLPEPCPKCGVLFSGRVCQCGYERKPISTIEVAEGELVSITGGRKAYTMEDKQKFWSMALWLAEKRGKTEKLALGLYKGKFGVWPRMLSDEPMPADQEFMNYEKSRRIAYAKMMEKKRTIGVSR